MSFCGRVRPGCVKWWHIAIERRTILLGVLPTLLGIGALQAQTGLVVRGLVQDEVTRRPLIGVTVAVTTTGAERSTRTDESGAFVFSGLAQGDYSMTARRVGFEPVTQTMRLASDTSITIVLRRLIPLDTVRIQAPPQAIYGVVVTEPDLRPVRGATVQILGTSSGTVSTDSSGRFFYPVRSPGPYMVRARADGLRQQMVSVVVPRHEGVELALTLDSAEAQNTELEVAFSQLSERLVRRDPLSAFVSRTELRAAEGSGIIGALLNARSVTAKALRFTDRACVFVDGTPRPGLSANSISPENVEAVEVYSATSDRSGTLRQRWPMRAPCGDTGMPRVSAAVGGMQSSSDVVLWIAIWMKS